MARKPTISLFGIIFFCGVAVLANAVLAAESQWQALPDKAPAPTDNPTTEAKVMLGKMLYFDTRFSSTGTISCFSCHNVMEGGDDHRPTSIGVHGQVGGRNAPTVVAATHRPFGTRRSTRHSFGTVALPRWRNKPRVRRPIPSKWA